MNEISVSELIITCEACGNVKKFYVKNEEESNDIFHNFRCENKCGRNLYSFITIGMLNRIGDTAQ